MKWATAICFGLALWATPTSVQAQFSGTASGGCFTITGYFGPGGTVAIPTNFDGLTVTGIAAGVFQFRFGVTNVIIPASVTNISPAAFSYCSTLTAITVAAQNLSYSSTNGVLFNHSQTTLVECPGGTGGSYTIPGTVTTIEADAFEACLNLTSVTIPSSVVTIGNEAFSDCTKLLCVAIPAGVTSIGEGAFELCASLTNATMTNGIFNIGEGAFSGSGLTTVTIPASVTNIGEGAFSSCGSLTWIAMAGPNAFYSSTNGVLFDQDQATLIEYPGGMGGSYTVPVSVTSIWKNAFAGSGLTNIVIPDSVTSIGEEAFERSDLTSVEIPDSVTNIAGQAFSECPRLTALTVDGQNAFYSSSSNVLFDISQSTLIQYPGGLIGSYIIPGSVISIGDSAFQSCVNLTGVTIPGTVTSIGDNAFLGCGLTSVTIPASVTNIGEYAFCCQDLTNVTIADGVTSIGELAFYASGLISVTIPGSVITIGFAAFASCSGLTNVVVANGVAGIGEEAFLGCGLTSITIPASVTSIGVFAFVNCTSLISVYFAGSAPNTDPSAFASDDPTVYYLHGTTGWSNFSSITGLTTVLWNPLIQTGDGSFGISNNQFGFTITGTTNIPIMVEACINLASPVWIPLTNVMLTNSFYFSDPQWANYPARYYGIGFP